MREATPNIGKTECIGLISPMELAWEQTFEPGMAALAPCLVIVWHSEWMYPHHGFWKKLHQKLTDRPEAEPTRILVIIFGDTPDDVGEEEQGNPLGVLLRALAKDADRTEGWRRGWASVSDVANFRRAAVKWTATPESAVLRLCKTCAALCDHWTEEGPAIKELPVPVLSEFFLFLSDPASFRARNLHDKPQHATQGLRVLKWLASHTAIPRSLPLNILLVENRPGHFPDLRVVGESDSCQVPEEDPRALSTVNTSIHAALGPLELGATPLGFPREARIYVVSKDFERLKSASGREDLERTLRVPNSGEGVPVNDMPPFRWGEVDLVLQDIVLDDNTKKADGLDLVPHYLEACPQALVFVLTSLDVESLVGAGDVNWRYVDCIVSKSALASLWYEYRRCFHERFGRMFWQPWIVAKSRSMGKPELGDRQSLRYLFRCLRQWQLEPDILGHGQGVQEMIDHAHRHVSAVWRLADDVLGTLLDNCRPHVVCSPDHKTYIEHLSVPERMLFAMSVWLHDIGHRGDDFLGDSVDVRANHAGISEYLLLRNPEAFDIAWLVEDFCRGDCKKPVPGTLGKRLLECRNALRCNYENGELCPIRKVGLLCRHHQSNAPLDENSIHHMSRKGKAPSPYSRVAVESDSGPALTSQESLAMWMDPDASLVGWQGSDIRRLDQFDLGVPKEALISLAGLLRMLDALQLHRARVGSPTSIDSFNAYLSTRAEWCRNELRRVEALVRTSPPGTKVYQKNLAEYMRLRRYERLLYVQYSHYWRQIAVRDVSVKWGWLPDGDATLRIVYDLDDRGLEGIEELRVSVPVAKGGHKGTGVRTFSLESALGDQVKDLLCNDGDIKLWFNRGTKNGNLAPLGVPEHLKTWDPSPFSIWAIHVRHDVVCTEHRSQETGHKSTQRAYVRFLPEGVVLEVAVLQPASDPLLPRQELLLLDREDF